MENMQEIIFMVFGLGFFIYVIWMVQNIDEKHHQQRMEKYREFGYPVRRSIIPRFRR